MGFLPSNVVAIFFAGLVGLVLGIRGLLRYRKVKSPLSLYFSLSGLFIGLATTFYALPFGLTSDQSLLKIAISIGDVFYYIAAIFAVKIIWYLGFRKSFASYWLTIPTGVLALIGLVADVLYKQNIEYGIKDNLVVTPISTITLLILILLTLSFILVGILTLREALKLQDSRQKLRLGSIGALFLLGGIAAEYNFIFLQGSNTSPTLFFLYGAAALAFMVGILVVRRPKNT